MRSPENVLKSLSEKAKNKEYRYERLYRNLYNPEFYLLAYQNIATSQGSMTAGADGLTLDGMSMERIEKLIAKLRDHSYQPNPARRVYIAKKNSNKKRPLGIPSTDDKLLQEVVRMILEAIYEPTFSDNSHGFRPKRSCHTALKEIVTLFTGAKWIIEGDIKACFDSFDHHITIQLLRKRIKDEAFISLMWKFLRAGYMEQWTYHETYSGSPQGSGVSPILANIYLNELDKFMGKMKKSFDKGDTRNRKVHKDHDKVRWAYRKAQKNLETERTEANLTTFKEARKVMLSTPHLDEMDILRICKSSEIPRYIVFHEFTHILDTEMYAKQDSWKYMALSGYTEYHAAQVELMIMLGADSIQTQDFSFTVDVEIGNSTVRNYLNSRHQLVVNMMNRTDFPRDIEALKTTVGVLYNYFGVRSICKMYAKDYTEEVDNTIIIQKLSKVLFEEINSFMVGWFNEAQVELSFVSYMKIMWPMLQSYFGKE